MSQVVDTRGKVRTNPTTRQVADRQEVKDQKKPGDINQLVSDAIETGKSTFSNALSDAMQAVRDRTSSPTTNRSKTKSFPSSTPTVQTASMTKPQNAELDFPERQPSYWDSVQDENQRLADQLDEHYLGDKEEVEDQMTPTFVTQGSAYKPGEGDMNRWGEEYREDPVGPVNTSWIGATRNNDRYEDLFATGFNGETEGMPPYELNTTHNRDTDGNWTSIDFDTGSTTPIQSQVVDDGTMDYEHLTSTKVLGSQLKRYARNGMTPGLSIDQIEQIDPDQVYDKTLLAADPNVNFIPYVPDGRTYVDMAMSMPYDVVSNATGELGNARDHISSVFNPYKINYNDGEQTRTYNGSKFDDGAYGYLSSVYRDRWDNPQRFFDDSHDNGGSWTQYAAQWQIPSVDGGVEYHYGEVTTPYVSNNDGTSNLVFDDGSTVQVSDAWLESLFDPESGNYVIPDDGSAWLIETPDGTVQRMYGEIEDLVTNNDGTSTVGFSDGTTATLDDSYIDSLETNANGWPMMEFNGMTDVTGLGLDTSQLNGTDFPDQYEDPETGQIYDQLNSPDVSSYWLPNYVMEDGTVIPYFDTLAIAGDSNGRRENKNLGENQSIDYDFGAMAPMVPVLPFGMTLTNTPSRLQSEPLSVEDGKIDFSQLLKNGADRWFDWTMGSLPIMIPQTQWPASIANAMQDFRGASSSSFNPYSGGRSYTGAVRSDDGSLRYGYSGDPIWDPRIAAGMASGGVPVTENLVGPIGALGSGSRFLEKFVEGPGWRNALGRWGLNVGSEGWEEVGGNAFEELQKYGVPGWYGNYVDENGNIVATEDEAAEDANGNPMKQEWSPFVDRLYNAGVPMVRDGRLQVNPEALVNNVNAFIGGAAIAAPMSAYEEIGNKADYDRQLDYLNSMGVDFYKEPELWRRRQAPEEYLEQWR